MAGANIVGIANGLKANLASLQSPTGGALQCFSYAPDMPTAPCAIVQAHRDPFLIRESMQMGVVSVYFDVILLVSNVVDDAAQAALDGYALSSGAGSVWGAIESDKTLGGAASNATVTQLGQYGLVEWNDTRYLGAVWLVRVLAVGA